MGEALISRRAALLAGLASCPPSLAEDGSLRLREGIPAELALHASARTGPVIAVGAWTDVEIQHEGGLTVLRGEVRVPCEAPRCVLPLVHPEERVSLAHETGGTATVSPLAVPAPIPLALGATFALDLPPGGSDPRGPFVDAELSVRAPSRVAFSATAPAPQPRPLLSVFGPAGPVAPEAGTHDRFVLEEGTYRVRVRPSPGAGRQATLTWTEAVPLDRDDEPLPSPASPWRTSCSGGSLPQVVPGEATATLAGPQTLEIPPEPAPAPIVLSFAPGPDLVLTYPPTNVSLRYRWGEEEGSCGQSPCILPRTRSGRLLLWAPSAPEAEELAIVALLAAAPAPSATLIPGRTVSVETNDPPGDRPEDARGPLAEVVLQIPRSGTYALGVTGGSEGVPLSVLAPFGGSSAPLADAARTGRFEGPGRYVVRIGGCGGGEPAEVTLSLGPARR